MGFGDKVQGGGGSQHTADFPAAAALKTGDGLIVVDSGDAVEVRKVQAGEIPDGWALKDYASGAKARMIIAGEIKNAPVLAAGGAVGLLPFSPGTLFWDLDDTRLTIVDSEGLDCGALLESEWLFPAISATLQSNGIDSDDFYFSGESEWGVVPGGALNNSQYLNQLKNRTIKGKTLGATAAVTLKLPPAENALSHTAAVDVSSPGQVAPQAGWALDMGDVPAGNNIVREDFLGIGGLYEGAIYRIDKDFDASGLQVRFDGTWNVGISIQMRVSSTRPTDLHTSGALVGSAANTGSNFSGNLQLTQSQSQEGSYFWFVLSSETVARIITNRRLRLDGSWKTKDPDWYVKAGDGAIFWLPANATKTTTLELNDGSNFKLADGTFTSSIALASGQPSPQVVYLVSDGTHWVRQASGWLKNTVYVSHHMLVAGQPLGSSISVLTDVSTNDRAAYTATLSGRGQPKAGDVVIISAAAAAHTNLGAATLAVNGGSAIAMKDRDGNALTGGEINENAEGIWRYNGTEWRLLAETRPDFDEVITEDLGVYNKTIDGGGVNVPFGGSIITVQGDWALPGALGVKTLLGGTVFTTETAWPQLRFHVNNWIVQDGGNLQLWYKDGSDPASYHDGTLAKTFTSIGYTKSGNYVGNTVPVGRRFWFTLGNLNAASSHTKPTSIDSNGQSLSSQPITVPGRFGAGLTKNGNKIVAGARITFTSGVAKNVLTGTTPAADGLKTDTRYLIAPPRSNDGAATLAVDGGPAYAIKRRDGSACSGGELRKDVLQEIVFTGAEIILLDDVRPDYPFMGAEVQKAAFDTGLDALTIGSIAGGAIIALPGNFTNQFSVPEVISHKTLHGGTVMTLEARWPKFGVVWNSNGTNVELYYKDGADPADSTDGTKQNWSGGTGNRYLDATDWPQGRRVWFRNSSANAVVFNSTVKILSGHDPDAAEAVFHTPSIVGRWKPHSLALTAANQDLVTGLAADDFVKITAISADGVGGTIEGLFKDLETKSPAGEIVIPLTATLERFEGAVTNAASAVFSGTCQQTDIIQAGLRLTGGGNKRSATMSLRFEDVDDNTWLPDNPENGRRVQFTKSGSTLSVEFEPPSGGGVPTDVHLSARRISDQTVSLELGNQKIQAKRDTLGPAVEVQCWVLPEGE